MLYLFAHFLAGRSWKARTSWKGKSLLNIFLKQRTDIYGALILTLYLIDIRLRAVDELSKNAAYRPHIHGLVVFFLKNDFWWSIPSWADIGRNASFLFLTCQLIWDVFLANLSHLNFEVLEVGLSRGWLVVEGVVKHFFGKLFPFIRNAIILWCIFWLRSR